MEQKILLREDFETQESFEEYVKNRIVEEIFEPFKEPKRKKPNDWIPWEMRKDRRIFSYIIKLYTSSNGDVDNARIAYSFSIPSSEYMPKESVPLKYGEKKSAKELKIMQEKGNLSMFLHLMGIVKLAVFKSNWTGNAIKTTYTMMNQHYVKAWMLGIKNYQDFQYDRSDLTFVEACKAKKIKIAKIQEYESDYLEFFLKRKPGI